MTEEKSNNDKVNSAAAAEDIPDFLKTGDVPKVEPVIEAPREEPSVVSEIKEGVKLEEAEVVESVEDDYSAMLEESKSPGFLGRIDELLVELNLERKHFYMLFGFLGFLLVLIILSFVFVFSLFENEPDAVNTKDEPKKVVVEEVINEDDAPGFLNRIFSRSTKDEPELEQEEEQDVTVDEKREIVSPIKDTTDLAKPVELLSDSNAIANIISLGESEIVDDKLSFYVRSYRKVRNIFNTDLFSYLNGVEDRQKGYDNYLIQFKASNEQLKLAYNDLLSEISAFDTRLDQLERDVLQIENEFFASLDNLESEALPDQLDSFQNLVTRRDIVKSELKAREAIGLKIQGALPVIASKIEAIELNQDAFVKGVKVVEFQQVDLDLIIESR